MERGLRLTFIIHCIVAFLIGLQHLIVPRMWTELAGIEISETVTWRLIGAALVAFAVSSWMAYRSQNWSAVKILVPMEVVWCILGAAVIIWGILFEGLPPLEWLNVGLLVAFGITFSFFWGKRESVIK